MTIGIVIGSYREGALGEIVGAWVEKQSAEREQDYRVISLRDYNLPFVEEPTPPKAANKTYANPQTQAFSKVIDSCDGFIFVTPEYNHGVPGPMKNAFDLLGEEWQDKAVAFVGYSFSGAKWAIKAWRDSTKVFGMQDIPVSVQINLTEDLVDGNTDLSRHNERLGDVMTQLENATKMFAEGQGLWN